MRVLVVTPWYPRAGDGAGSFVEDHARVIAGHAGVAVVHLAGAERGRPVETGGDWPVLRYPLRGGALPGGRALGEGLAVLDALGRLRRGGFAPDLLHAHVFSSGLACLPLARSRSLPLVVSEHLSTVALGEASRRDRAVARAAYTGADVVCPPSDSLAGAVRDIAPAARVEVVPNPVDTELFRPAAPRRPGRRLLAVASLVPVKGVDVLVAAAHLLAERGEDFELTVIGDGPERQTLERQAGSGPAAGRVTFAGRGSRRSVAEALREADLFVVPSRWETFSVATAEALCSGLPVVAARAGALAELVDERSGRLVAREDPAALAAGIAEALAAGFDREAIAARARARWGAEAVARRWAEIHTRLSAGRS